MKKLISPICSCILCKKEYSSKGIHSHYHVSHTSEGKDRLDVARLIAGNKGGRSLANKMEAIKTQKVIEYNKNPIKCKHCSKSLPYEKYKEGNVFCDNSCSAKHSSLNRILNGYVVSVEHRNKVSASLKSKTNPVQKDPSNVIPTGEYSRVFNCTCQHCGIKRLYRTRSKYCSKCTTLYSHDGRAKYWFTFNVFHYPKLFDLSLITTHGFRNNKNNPNGITRDHRVSVNYAIRNNCDSYYIKHPLNCDLMFFDDNNKKKTSCSISYEYLIMLVDEYDSTLVTGGSVRV